MKLNKNNVWIVISLVVICMNTISLSKQKANANFEMSSQIARPIIELEKDEIIKRQIEENAFPMEYYFCINNYREDEVNEIAFDYRIEIENSVDNFPIGYTLVDCGNNEEITLINGKSDLMQIKKSEKESRKFKLILNWRELNSDLAEKLQIKLRISLEQSKEDEI